MSIAVDGIYTKCEWGKNIFFAVRVNKFEARLFGRLILCNMISLTALTPSDENMDHIDNLIIHLNSVLKSNLFYI